MGWRVLVCALGFAMAFEAFLPLVSPRRWRRYVESMLEVPDGVLQKAAAGMVVAGLALVWLVQGGFFE